jgi:hypothetical protein
MILRRFAGPQPLDKCAVRGWMQAKHVDLTRSIYIVSESNLTFELKEMIWAYTGEGWEVRQHKA